MRYSWIIDVLQDLQVFALSNGMAELAGQLAETSKLAEVEIAQRTVSTAKGAIGDGSAALSDHREPAGRSYAW